MRSISGRNETLLISIMAVVLSLSSFTYFFFTDLSNANGDVLARLNISRRVVDSPTPGFAHIGYVWPPIQSFLMLPFIWIDSFYWSGLAGIIPSLAAFILSAIFIFKISAYLAGKLAGYIAFTFFTLNPNILYIQATSLSEIFYIGAILGMIWYIIKWVREEKERHLIISGVFLLLATLSRYDGWFLALVTLVLLGAYEFFVSRDIRKAEAVAVLFATIALFGPFLWILWNYTIFGNPFYFLTGEYTSKVQQASLLEAGFLPSYHNLSDSIMQVFYASGLVNGAVLIIAGSLGFLAAIWYGWREKRLEYIFLIVLALQIFYYVINLFFGNGVIFVPQLYPHKMHNIRYAATFVPFFVIMASILASRIRWFAPAIALFVFIEYGALASTGSIITLNESLHGFAGRDVHKSGIEAGEWLRDHYDKGYILVDIFDNDAAAFYSRVPLKNWLTDGTPEEFRRALGNPSAYASWVFVRERDKMSKTFAAGSGLYEKYDCVYQNDDVTIYKLKSKENKSACNPEVLALNSLYTPQ